MAMISVNSPTRPYSIHIETGLLARLGECIQRETRSTRAILVVDANIASSHGQFAGASLREAGITTRRFEVTANEPQKSLENARQIYAAMIDAGLDRTSVVIALGGGIVGDLAGFAAATFMRGLRIVHVPSTLLAMVDASIGGKTAVNFVQPDGSLIKNLVGSFWQPSAVLVDPQLLLTLNDRDYRCGLAECVKHALIADRTLLEFIRAKHRSILAKEIPIVQMLIERSAAVKVAVVERDEDERGDRALLNLGHTFAHAMESLPELDVRHGEAVSIGLCAASWLSTALQMLSPPDQQVIAQTLQEVGLPTRLPDPPVGAERLSAAMRHDKKAVNRQARLVLPIELGRARIVTDVSDELIAKAWRFVGAA